MQTHFPQHLEMTRRLEITDMSNPMTQALNLMDDETTPSSYESTTQVLHLPYFVISPEATST